MSANPPLTQVSHNRESRTKVIGYEGAGSYQATVTYSGASYAQVRGLANYADSCDQFFKYECCGSIMNGYAWWVSYSGAAQKNWKSGTTGICTSSCTCDKNDHTLRYEDGYFTNKAHFPVTKLQFGDTGNGGEYGYHTLGKLRCKTGTKATKNLGASCSATNQCKTAWSTCSGGKCNCAPGFTTSGSTCIPPASCAFWKSAGQTKTQDYMIDPDGNGGQAPFMIRCDMSKNPPEAIAYHSVGRTKVKGYENPRSYSKTITYNNGVTTNQLKVLADKSASCSQTVKYECYGSILNGYGAWYDRSGNVMNNWGTPTGTNGCPCLLSKNCAGTNCHCNKNDNTLRTDSGTLTDKSKFPLTKVAFGDNGDASEYAYYTIGPLICKSSYASKLGEACTANNMCIVTNSDCNTSTKKCKCKTGYAVSGSNCALVNCGTPPTLSNTKRTGTTYTYNAKVTYSCVTGYQVKSGSTSRTCGSNKAWSGSNLVCTKVSCGTPPTIGNTARSGSTYTYQAKVTYSCVSGYQRASGSTTKTCGSNKAWSGSNLVCTKVSCGTPPTISNTARSGSTYTYGASVTYSCNTGYQVASGSTKRTCGANKAWSGSNLVCTKVSCGDPGSVSMATKSGTSYVYQAKVTYACKTGYELKSGHLARTCGSNKAWSGSKPVCGKVSCGDPGTVANSAKSGTSYLYGDKVTHTCKSGYELKSGHLQRTCGSNKAWSGTKPVCGRVSCGDPGTVSYASKGGKSYLYGDKVTYTCATGYETKSGSTSRTCGANKAWSGSKLVCGKVSCGTPPSLSNTKRSGTTYTYQATVTYSCNTGYKIASGSTKKTCASNKKWSGTSLVCTKVSCGTPPSISHTQRTGTTYTYQASVTYACSTGYQIVSGSTKRTCGSNKVWSGSNLVCTKVSCGDPGSVSLASKSGTSFVYQSKVTYSCVSGYEVKQGNLVRTCGSNKAWSGTKPVCGKVSCGDPGTIAHSAKSGTSYLYQDKVTYSCSSGYELKSGNLQRTCGPTKAWSGAKPVCGRVSCGDPGSVTHAAKSGSSYLFGDKVTYTCNPGYEPKSGSTSRTCQANKAWSGNKLVCGKVSCGDPGPVSLATKAGSSYLYQDKVTYSCITGHEVKSGNAVRTCGTTKSWSGTKPLCGKVVCGNAATTTNGKVASKSYVYQDKATYTCDTGYEKKAGDMVLTCGANKQFVGTKPTCGKVSCGDPGAIANGAKSGSNYLYGDKVTYTCIPGYELKAGDLQRTCTPTKAWSGAKPVCGKIGCKDPGVGPGAARNGSSFVFGDSLSYWCKTGWNVTSGVPKVSCKSDKTWSGAVLQCGRLSCGHPGKVMNGSIHGKDFLFETTLNFTCDKGFEIKSGSSSRKCLADQSWTGTQPKCGKVVCPLTLPTGVQVATGEKNPYEYRDQITLSCKTGYKANVPTPPPTTAPTVNPGNNAGNKTTNKTGNVGGGKPANKTMAVNNIDDTSGTCMATGSWKGAGLTCYNIDDCSPNPCQNGGVCADGINDYTCTCTSKYSGKSCTTLVTTPAPADPLAALMGRGGAADVKATVYVCFLVAAILALFV